MERIVYRISLDATKSGIQGTLQGFMTGDILSRRIEITLAYRGESVALTESETAVMYIHKTGAETPSINSCTIDGDKVIYDVLQSDVDTAGITKMQLKIVSGEQVLMSPYFAIEVTDSMTGDTQAVTTPTYTALETALAQAQTVYNSRLISVELGEDLIFTATYADGTIYTSDAIANEIGGVSEAEAARIIAEENRVLAESERANEFSTMKNDVQRAVNTTTELQNEVKSLVDSNVVTTEDRQKWDGKADGLSYVGSKLSLLNGDEVLNTVEIIGGGGEVVIPDKVLTATNVTAMEAVTPVLNAELFGSRAPEAYALKEELTAHNVPRLSFDSLTDIETFVNNYSASFDDGIFYEFEVNGVAEYELSEGVWYISGTKTDSLYETQAAKRYCPDGVEVKRRSKYNGEWSRWVADVNALDLANITNGTTKVGNADKLDGHDAEYFAPLSLLMAQKMPVGTDLNDCRELGTYYFDSYATNYVNVPSDTAHNGIMVVRKQSSIRLVQEYVAINTGRMYTRTTGNATTWDVWKEIASTAYIANELATKLANYLPLTGGKIENSNPHALGIGNTASDLVLPYYRGVSGLLGYLGFNGENNPVFATKAGLLRPLLHTGNKPTGIYTGNGDATARTINTGGVGSTIAIYSASGGIMAIVTAGGSISSSAASMTGISGSEAKFVDGVLTLATTNSRLNANGITYTYQVL